MSLDNARQDFGRGVIGKQELSYNSPLDDPKFMADAAANNLAYHFDADGSLGVWTPGEHDKVPADLELQEIFSKFIEAFIPFDINTGRPQIFVDRIMPALVGKFPVVTEHGALVNVDGVSNDMVSNPVDVLKIRRQLIDQLSAIPGCFVEDHKTRSMTAQCTDCTDPESFTTIVSILQSAADQVNAEAKQDILRVKESNIPGNVVADLIHVEADKDRGCEFISNLENFREKRHVAVIDSSGDKSMAEWVRANGGYVITIGEYDGVACDFRLRDTQESREVLLNISNVLLLRLSQSPHLEIKEKPTNSEPIYYGN